MHEKSVIGQLPEGGGDWRKERLWEPKEGGGMKIREYRKGTEMCRLLLGKEVGEIEGRELRKKRLKELSEEGRRLWR